jgi:hypothetical protein
MTPTKDNFPLVWTNKQLPMRKIPAQAKLREGALRERVAFNKNIETKYKSCD